MADILIFVYRRQARRGDAQAGFESMRRQDAGSIDFTSSQDTDVL